MQTTPARIFWTILAVCAGFGLGLPIALWLLLGIFGFLIRYFPWG